jgi:predicted ABC-type ATPase
MPVYPQLLFVAGPNGAGKSTFSKKLSKSGAIIFDVDKVIARIEALSPGMPKKQVTDTATNEFILQANEAIRLKQHFTLETNFRDKGLIDVVTHFKRHGYTANMVYLALNNIKESVSRVNQRVKNGGHYVDLKNIQQNFDLGLEHLETFADRFDSLEIIDASGNSHQLRSVLSIQGKQLVYLSADLPAGAEEAIKLIAGRYNFRGLDDDEEMDRPLWPTR